ncbi:MAG TPA: aminotransferase class I/II-fold pyridoxal phosphate-dependent enzyme [Acidimicrobiales bacterium]|nr:aminotransferase class I/II-fold pyridoxal phosphate-dependent enzyme [Acidimicrobiales bacterium]
MAGEPRDLPATSLLHGDAQARKGAVVPPIVQAATFAAGSSEEFLDLATRSFADEFYLRYGNPNHTQVAAVVATLEGAERAMVTASGMGAVSTIALALLKAGDHVVVQRSVYPGTTTLTTDLLARFEVSADLVAQNAPEELESLMRPSTRLVFVESPSNPLLGITDLRRFADIAHRAGALLIADNTVATPLNQRPVEFGADLVWHSATKYLAGHSDVAAGIVVGPEELVERVWRTHLTLGAVLGPFDAWLLLRGLRTLDVRMARHNENGDAIARFLVEHPDVVTVYYPGLSSHPQHDLAASQMTGFGGLVSFVVRGGAERADRLLDALRLTTRAASLGSVHSLASRPAAMWSGRRRGPDEDMVDDALIRLSVGIEAKEDVIADLARALALTSKDFNGR